MSINVNGLSYDYPGKHALDNITFTIENNTITALVGPNGAGKTTLMRAMAALAPPMKGTITIQNWDVDSHPREVHKICSYLSDFFGLYDDLTVYQSLKFFALSHGITENLDTLIQNTAKDLQIDSYLESKAKELSRGYRQRLAIAQSIIHNPKVLLLDEPAAGLDPSARFHLSELLKKMQKNGMTIVVSSHILSELEDYCSHMIVLNDGRLIKKCSLKELNAAQENILIEVELSSNNQTYVDAIISIPGVVLVSTKDKVVSISLNVKILSQENLLKTLVEKQIPVVGLRPQQKKMQDIYRDVMPDSGSKE